MINPSNLRFLWESELATDRAFDDVTGALLGEAGKSTVQAVIFTKQKGVFCGEPVVQALADLGLPGLAIQCLAKDGQAISPSDRLVSFTGSARLGLALERTLLNLLTHLCGVASLTRRYVDATRPHSTKILATRKTLPGLRELQLHAVTAGGGYVHRRSLSDGILIKENHQQFVPAAELVRRARANRSPLHRIELEIQDLTMLEALGTDLPDVLMLDNMDIETIRKALQIVAGRCEIEISGGLKVEQVPALAALGVSYLSVGALTHSAVGLDLSLDFEEVSKKR